LTTATEHRIAVESGGCEIDALGRARGTTPNGNDRDNMINEGHRRIAYCECGAQLAGGTEEELFDAAQRHIAHHHPQLLGAVGLEVVLQMAEDVGG
jgi:hypothetical protein